MKSIGIVCYPTFGGSGIIASQLGMGLSENYNVHFICYEKPVKLNMSSPNIFFHKVDIPIYPLFEYPPYELALTTRIVEVVQNYNLDLIHVHYAIPHAYAAVNAQKILSEQHVYIPIVTTLHGTDITLVGKSPNVLSAVNYAINSSSLVTAVSNSLKSDTLQYFDIKNDIKVIPNFIDFSINRNSFHNLNKRKKILHISNFRPVKRTLDVVEIFSIINQKIDCELVMIGDGPDLEKTRSHALSKGLESSVNFIGYSKQIDLVLETTDLFLLPSETESFGLVALEAMSFGVPVISTSSGGLPELVIDNFNGYTSSVGDVEKMAKNSINLLSNNNLYKEISFNAYETAKKYDLRLIVSMYEESYKELFK
ncbi:MAG: N-acetyl-alpha-D-glucosaminyl L-malate synthase BshA [Flavobacteriales bacterium]|nr:N-acetyl-alpha-D-glucosaminyl L-malate synthase BshA [Flavobacteriales bacterium]|tara:strand:- start:11000 stop:12100 length:1101 start_codon:yes stop_codon:yes gene_type:complete